MKLLVLDGSARPCGHTITVVKNALGSEIEYDLINVRQLDINHCTGCQKCFSKGVCIFNDDFSVFEEKLKNCDALVVSSPLYFNGLPSVFKTLIDRCEVFYAKKVLLKEKLDRKKGLIVMSSGMNRTSDFDGALDTLRLFFLSMNIKEYETVLIAGTDRDNWQVENQDLNRVKVLVESL